MRKMQQCGFEGEKRIDISEFPSPSVKKTKHFHQRSVKVGGRYGKIQIAMLTGLLGHEEFRKVFLVILTDNGSEFKHTRDLETTEDGKKRTKVFCCDPQASWQKPQIEKNHEFIRYVLPKGKTLNPYTQEDIVRILNVPTTLIDFQGQEWIFDMINIILIEVMGAVAEEERKKILERQKEGIAAMPIVDGKKVSTKTGRPMGNPGKELAEFPKFFEKTKKANFPYQKAAVS